MGESITALSALARCKLCELPWRLVTRCERKKKILIFNFKKIDSYFFKTLKTPLILLPTYPPTYLITTYYPTYPPTYLPTYLLTYLKDHLLSSSLLLFFLVILLYSFCPHLFFGFVKITLHWAHGLTLNLGFRLGYVGETLIILPTYLLTYLPTYLPT